ncbi:MAG: hypothetical protein COA54_14865 [Thiotrichaceae bacterium]|nr:MAG: hypothetical protein COA54_14865 [Thiotrichaceae bacterium]
MGGLPQLSERLLRVLGQHDNNWTSMGTPASFCRGEAVVAAFFGYFLGLQKKSNSSVGRDPQCLSKKMKGLRKTPIRIAGNSKPDQM